MRTGCSLIVSRSLLPGGSARGGVSASWGVCLLWRGVSAPRGCLLRGCLLLGGVCSGGCLLPGGGVSAPRGVGIPACTGADTPPVNRITDTSKNITLATTSWQPVITGNLRDALPYKVGRTIVHGGGGGDNLHFAPVIAYHSNIYYIFHKDLFCQVRRDRALTVRTTGALTSCSLLRLRWQESLTLDISFSPSPTSMKIHPRRNLLSILVNIK